MSEATYAACLANGADLSLSGYERRLSAARIAIRYRNPETGRRYYVHNKTFSASFARSTLRLRRIVRRLRRETAPAGCRDRVEALGAEAHSLGEHHV